MKPQRLCCKLWETIEQPCSDVLPHTPEVCKGAHLFNRYLASKDDHDSWGMCTTSVESQTITTAVSGTWVGLVLLGQFWSVLLVRLILRSGLHGVIDVSLSRC
jgi:hypothetical protein